MKKVLVSMPEQLVVDLDAYCGVYHYERSEFIRSIVRDKIYEKREPVQQASVPTKIEPPSVGNVERTYTVTREVRFCGMHFEAGVEYECQLVNFEDADGNRVIDHIWACPTCLAELQSRDYGVLTIL